MTAQGHGFFREGRLEGYTYTVKNLLSFRDNALEATDVVLTTPEALASFLGFLAGHRAFFTNARWPSAPGSALLLSLPEPWQYTLKLEEHWLLRIVSVPAALTQRGYPTHLQGALDIEVEDPWLESNSRRWRLQLSNGQATLEQGGEGSLRLDVGALASLYSGFVSAHDLHLAGRAKGNAETLNRASAFFGGWTPQLLDFF
jgi:predicted acetyltransferase